MKKETSDGKIIIRISIIWVFVLVIVIASIVAFFRNYIFAANETSVNEEEVNQEELVNIEPNENAIDVLQLMVENNYANEKIVNEERDIDYEIVKEDDSQLPEGEEVVFQKGILGKKQITALQVYENGVFSNENIIESILTKEPEKEIVKVGTSEFLKKYSVHIGDEMYLIEKIDLKQEPDENSETLSTINRYLDVELIEVSEEWAKVKYKTYEGYIQNEKLTSNAVMPKVKEKNRIAKLQDNLNIKIDVSKVSGLTLSDYKTILGYNISDKNETFANNVEVFYNAEQKYQINGVFLAAIGIHESAWGTSQLAKEKNNLFGYRAYDRDPINCAQDFESYEDCINTVAEALAKNYLSSTGSFYNGTTIQAVNTKYASDKQWYTKVFSYMEYLYDKLG